MEDGATNEFLPDLKDVEAKVGRKTPEGLLKWMQDEATHRLEAKSNSPACIDRDPARKSLDEKIRKLKAEMVHLRSVDVRILHQLVALHEGIEAVKWLLEERSTLTSRCSSLTSSQYSLADGQFPDATSNSCSWRGSLASLHGVGLGVGGADGHSGDRLDNMSIGSFLDTLADDMDEYGGVSSSESVLCCSSTAQSTVTEATTTQTQNSVAAGTMTCNTTVTPTRGAVSSGTTEGQEEVWTRNPNSIITGHPHTTTTTTTSSPRDSSAISAPPGGGTGKDKTGQAQVQDQPQHQEHGKCQPLSPRSNGSVLGRGLCESARACLAQKLGMGPSSKSKPPSYPNGHGELETCKLNGRVLLEYDAHWRWVQSQDDVTFL